MVGTSEYSLVFPDTHTHARAHYINATFYFITVLHEKCWFCYFRCNSAFKFPKNVSLCAHTHTPQVLRISRNNSTDVTQKAPPKRREREWKRRTKYSHSCYFDNAEMNFFSRVCARGWNKLVSELKQTENVLFSIYLSQSLYHHFHFSAIAICISYTFFFWFSLSQCFFSFISTSLFISFSAFYTKLFSNLIPNPSHFVFIYLWFYSYFDHEAPFSPFILLHFRHSMPLTVCYKQHSIYGKSCAHTPQINMIVVNIFFFVFFFFWRCSKFQFKFRRPVGWLAIASRRMM